MSGTGSDYELGSAEDELARLELQGRALAPATRMILDAAGIRPGMRVLDLGCGAGDVTFAAAGLAGSEGSVVGVDRSPDELSGICSPHFAQRLGNGRTRVKLSRT